MTDSESKVLCSLSATKPNSSIPKANPGPHVTRVSAPKSLGCPAVREQCKKLWRWLDGNARDHDGHGGAERLWTAFLLYRVFEVLTLEHCGASTQSQYFVVFSFRSSGYQLGCTVAAVSASGPCQKCTTKYHDQVDAPQCTSPEPTSASAFITMDAKKTKHSLFQNSWNFCQIRSKTCRKRKVRVE